MAVTPSLLIPQRNPRLIERIARAIFRSQPQYGPQPQQQQSTVSGVTVSAVQAVYDRAFRVEMERLAVYRDADEMDEVSEEVGPALDTIADNATTSEDGMQMTFAATSEDQRVADVLDQVTNDAHLHRIVYSVVRNLVKYGDNFTEIVVNADGQVTELRQLPPATMYRNQDARGDLRLGRPEYAADGTCTSKPGGCAFEQRAEETEAVVAAFWPWQIVHMRNNHDGFRAYGRSHLRTARVIWRKLKAVEEAMIIARLARAYPKLKVLVDTTGLSPTEAETAIGVVHEKLNERQAIDGRREQPYSILSDIYMGVPKVRDSEGKFSENSSDVELLEPKGDTVYNIDDIKGYFHRKLLVCLRVPPAHMGWEEQVNAKATLTQQDVQYVRFLRRIQQQVGQALEQVFDTALVLAGIDPQQAEYEIAWPMLSATDEAAAADAEFSRAQADNLYAELKVIDAEWIQRHRFDMTDEEIEEIKARMEEANQAAVAAAAAMAPPATAPGQPAAAPAPVPAAAGDVGAPEDENQGREQRHPVAAEVVQPRGAPDRSSVILLSEAIKGRTLAMLERDVDRVLDEQREALSKAREINEAVA